MPPENEGWKDASRVQATHYYQAVSLANYGLYSERWEVGVEERVPSTPEDPLVKTLKGPKGHHTSLAWLQ